MITEFLRGRTYRWLVTGATGFIGSHIMDRLLELNQEVVGLDDMSNGRNMRFMLHPRAQLIRADINDLGAVRRALQGCQFVLHQAGLGSVPRSFREPRRCFEVNAGGFNTLYTLAAEVGSVRALVYASSSAAYGLRNGGEEKTEKRVEGREGRPSSPYGMSKRMMELTDDIYTTSYGLPTVALRYFNVYGPRQRPDVDYPAVIPIWMHMLTKDRDNTPQLYGSPVRDFTYVGDVVEANILAAMRVATGVGHFCVPQQNIFNIGTGHPTQLRDLFFELKSILETRTGITPRQPPLDQMRARVGDVEYSVASVKKVSKLLGWRAKTTLSEGLRETVSWYLTEYREGAKDHVHL